MGGLKIYILRHFRQNVHSSVFSTRGQSSDSRYKPQQLYKQQKHSKTNQPCSTEQMKMRVRWYSSTRSMFFCFRGSLTAPAFPTLCHNNDLDTLVGEKSLQTVWTLSKKPTKKENLLTISSSGCGTSYHWHRSRRGNTARSQTGSLWAEKHRKHTGQQAQTRRFLYRRTHSRRISVMK